MKRLLAVVSILSLFAISQYAFADPTSVTLAITPSSGQMVGTYKFSMTFSDAMPDNYDVMISYKLASEDASKYKPLFGITRATSPLFTKNGNTISTDLQLSNFITGIALGTYDFKISAGTDIATKSTPDIQSSPQQVAFTSRCTRQNPTVTLTPSSYSFTVPYGKTLSDSKQFTVTVKNNDAEGCGSSRFIINIGSPTSGVITATHNQPSGIVILPGIADSSTVLTVTAKNLPKGTWAPTITFINQDALQEEGKTYSASANANFVVTEGAKPCERNPPEVDITNPQPVFPGMTVEYTTTIKNRDSAACGGSIISFSNLRGIVIGWRFTIDTRTVYIDPGSSGTLKFKIKSTPDTTQRDYSMTACFTNTQSGQSNCGDKIFYGGPFYYTVKALTGSDTTKPSLQVSLMPENPLPNRPAEFSITTSDNEQMKSIQLFIGPNLEQEWSVKDPEATVTKYSKAFSQGKYGYYVLASDYNNNQVRFPETGLQQIDVKDRPDLTVKSITNPAIKPGDTVTITVDVSNIGTVTASNVKVRLEVPESSFSADKSIDSISRDSIGRVAFDVKFANAGDYNLKATIDPSNSIDEASENNNVLSQKITVGARTVKITKGYNLIGFGTTVTQRQIEESGCKLEFFNGFSQDKKLQSVLQLDTLQYTNLAKDVNLVATDTMEPFKGYLLYATQGCSVTVNDNTASSIPVKKGYNLVAFPKTISQQDIAKQCGGSLGDVLEFFSGFSQDKRLQTVLAKDQLQPTSIVKDTNLVVTDTAEPWQGYLFYSKVSCALKMS